MKTIILPGYSPRNKEWALEIKENLSLGHEVIIHQWNHWKGGSFSLQKELLAIKELIGDEKVNVIAKSVGTRVVMHLSKDSFESIEKVILCGIPTKGLTTEVQEIYSQGLLKLDLKKVIVFQNTSDPFASYKEIASFMGMIKMDLKVIEKPRKDHHYPYAEDFQRFLSE